MNYQKVRPILYDTYLAIIKNSLGCNLFRNLYAKVGRKKVDITQDGVLSCAFFVSSILFLFKLIKKPHATVDKTVKDLKQSGWKRMRKPKIGSILVWEAIKFDGGDIHKHIGFYIGNKKAISNSFKVRRPVIHHWTLGIKKKKPVREIEAILWNDRLNVN